MASQTMLAGMKFSITGTPNSHVHHIHRTHIKTQGLMRGLEWVDTILTQEDYRVNPINIDFPCVPTALQSCVWPDAKYYRVVVFLSLLCIDFFDHVLHKTWSAAKQCPRSDNSSYKLLLINNAFLPPTWTEEVMFSVAFVCGCVCLSDCSRFDGSAVRGQGSS